MSDAVDQFDFYPCMVDDKPASIYLNLRFEDAAQRAGADTRYGVTIQMREAGPYGIGTAEEASVLDAFEEALIARLAEAGLRYVGRLRHRAQWEVTFYGPAGRDELVRAAAAARLDGRRVEAQCTPDASWRYYVELLLPDAERTRWMDDRRLVQVLREQGDRLVTPRRVDHRVSFATEPARAAFLDAIARHGFTLQRLLDAPASDRPFGVSVSRTDPIELDHIHDVVMQVVDAATPHGGHYDRWETSIES